MWNWNQKIIFRHWARKVLAICLVMTCLTWTGSDFQWSKICQDTASGHLSKGGRVKLILREISLHRRKWLKLAKATFQLDMSLRECKRWDQEKHDKLNPWRFTWKYPESHRQEDWLTGKPWFWIASTLGVVATLTRPLADHWLLGWLFTWAEVLFCLEAFMDPQDAIPRESVMKQGNVRRYKATIRPPYASPLHCRTANPVLTRFVVKDIFLYAPQDGISRDKNIRYEWKRAKKKHGEDWM